MDIQKIERDVDSTFSSQQSPHNESIQRGQWYWMADEDEKEEVLTCVTHVGSNYARLETPEGSYWKIHFNKFDKEVGRRELEPEKIISENIEKHQKNVNFLLGKIKQLMSSLSLTPLTLPDGQTKRTTALAVAHGTADVNKYKKDLIRAKEKTLPDLFKKVEEEHGAVAIWMKARLIPMKTETKVLKKQTETIEDKIFTVELYAGLCEDMVKIQDGEPASNDEKVCLFQRQHYMDEECLVAYEAGGMDFKNIKDFDKWILKKSNRDRILPFPKCIVTFRIRRDEKHRHAQSLSDFIDFSHMREWDKATFLYIRNGERLYRLETDINFGADLFPNGGVIPLTEGKLYIRETEFSDFDLIPEHEYLTVIEEKARLKAKYQEELATWKKLSKDEKKKTMEPFHRGPFDTRGKYIVLSQDSVYYDKAMEKIEQIAKDHNRIAIVLQGILDRSEALHPHPPWQLWTQEGFDTGITLIFDSHSLSAGDPPDFKSYRAKLNQSLANGTHTVGQQESWEKDMAEKENERQRNDWRIKNAFTHEHLQPYGNPGPGKIATISSLSRDKSKCFFQWKKQRRSTRWVRNLDKPGFMKRDESEINSYFHCHTSKLLNVDAYQPGDYKQFYNDPRTRADYLKWAPLLLAAEDFKNEENKKK